MKRRAKPLNHHVGAREKHVKILYTSLSHTANFELNLVNSLICGWLGSGTSYLMNMIFTDKGVNFFHNHTDAAQQQGCPDCGPYRRMGLEEIAGAYEHDGGQGNEQ